MNTLSTVRLTVPAALALDLGTSSVRAIVYDAAGLAIADLNVQRPYQPTLTSDGGATFDPLELRDHLFACLDAICQQPAMTAIDCRAVGIDTFATNLMAIDAAGQPITPVYSWNDTRSRQALSRLTADADARYDRTGTPLHSSFWPARLLWIREQQPDIWQRAVRWLSVGEWLQESIFGVAQCSLSLAAWTGLLNRRSGDWDASTLAQIGLDRDRLSVIDDQPLGRLPDALAERWPPLRNSVWHGALADGYAANIGSGAITPDRAALTIGTSGALRVLVAGVPETVPRGLFCYRVSATQSLIGGAVSNAGNVYAWLQQTLKLSGDPFAAEAQGDTLPLPDAHGLTVQPFWASERSPGWRDEATAQIAGMTLDTTADDIARAALEAVLYEIATVDDLLAGAVGSRPAIYAAGGVLASSPGWAQVTADILGRAVHLCADPQASARGTALLALGNPAAAAQVTIERTYQARPAFNAVYQAARARHHTAPPTA